jgi:hypothetical protein
MLQQCRNQDQLTFEDIDTEVLAVAFRLLLRMYRARKICLMLIAGDYDIPDQHKSYSNLPSGCLMINFSSK